MTSWHPSTRGGYGQHKMSVPCYPPPLLLQATFKSLERLGLTLVTAPSRPLVFYRVLYLCVLGREVWMMRLATLEEASVSDFLFFLSRMKIKI